MKEGKTTWYYSTLQTTKGRTRSALTEVDAGGFVGGNAYAEKFIQGATIVPRNFYLVELLQDVADADLTGSVVNIKTSDASLREAKAPWKKFSLAGRVEGALLYRTALAKSILPFALVDPPLIVLPVDMIEESYRVMDHEELLKEGYKYGSKWFWEADKCWEANKTQKAEQSGLTLIKRLDFQRGLTEQGSANILVLYTSSAQDASAVVVDRRKLQLPFVVDHKAYWFAPQSLKEAHYVCAYLNSGYANEQIKEFQSRGLFGPRDIHKTIVRLPFPKFDPKDETHLSLAALGAACDLKASKFLVGVATNDLQARALGRIRSKMREELQAELSEIDVLVEQLSTGKSETLIRSAAVARRGRKPRMAKLF